VDIGLLFNQQILRKYALVARIFFVKNTSIKLHPAGALVTQQKLLTFNDRQTPIGMKE
jgi:hypothetical protein